MNFLRLPIALAACLLCFSPLSAQQFWSQSSGSPEGTARHDDIFFVNEFVGYAVKNSSIHKTTDGGETWEEKLSQPGTHFRSIGFLSETRGFAGNLGVESYDRNVTDPNVLYETFDGGDTWSVVAGINETGIAGLCAFHVLDSSHIYGVGRVRGPAFLIKSTDAGATWSAVDLTAAGVMNALMDVHFKDPMNGFVVGMDDNPYAVNCATPYFGRIAKTTDGGETWTPVLTTEVSCSYFWKMSWPTANVGYVSLQQNGPHDEVVFYKTIDGGETWTSHEIPFSEIGTTSFYLQGIGFVDEDEGWMGGNSNAPPGSFIHTTDGGVTWTPDGYDNTARINKIRFVSPLLGFASGTKIHIYRSPLAITGHPESQSSIAGHDVILTVTAIGDSPISYQWQKENVDLPGETGPWLVLRGVGEAAAGRYRVLVSNAGRELISRSAEISVEPAAGLTYENWAEVLPPGERGANDDPGGRGASNLLRYALGMDPNKPELASLPNVNLVNVLGEEERIHLAVTFTRRKNAIGLLWSAQVSDDLLLWLPFDFTENVRDDGNGVTETVTLTDLGSMKAHQRRFLRVKVEK